MSYVAPHAVTTAHVTAGFDCGEPALDRWLLLYALPNEVMGRSRTFVVTRAGSSAVVGYYCLSTAMLEFAAATTAAAAGMPRHEPLPAVLLGRLAVDRKHQGGGLGSALLADAVKRTHFEIARNAGVRVLLVHAKDAAVQQFYLARGFEPSPTDPLHLMLLMQDVEKTLG